LLAARGVSVAPLEPANCGFDASWSSHLADRYAGSPLKPVVAHWRDTSGREHQLQGECVLTATGIEGSLVYALSATLRALIARDGEARLELDLAPGRSLERLGSDLSAPRGRRSLSEILRRRAAITGVKAALLHEVLGRERLADPQLLARTIKRLPLTLRRPRPLAEAISTAGGVRLESLDGSLMLQPNGQMPAGVFCAGEMLDWEAPTGGYLLTASCASGRRAGAGAAAWLRAAGTTPAASAALQ
jgi:uncharacterized flavoprotein (TIGR03862 family)